MGEASAAKVFGTELTQQVARQLLEVLDHNGLRRGADAPLRGALESAYRVAVINTFGGGANEIQRDIIAMAGLGMPRAPRDLRADGSKSGGPTQVTDADTEFRNKLRALVGQPTGGTGKPSVAPDPVNQPMIRHWAYALADMNPGLPRPGVRGRVAVRRHRVTAGHAANLDDAVAETGGHRRAGRCADGDQEQSHGVPR